MHVILVVIQLEPSDTSDEYEERNPIQLKADEEYFELLELFCEVHEGKRGSPTTVHQLKIKFCVKIRVAATDRDTTQL